MKKKAPASPKPLNAGAQRARDLAQERNVNRPARKRATSVRRQAIDAGIATKAEATANARGARAARSAVRRAVGKVKPTRMPLPGRFKAVAAGAAFTAAAVAGVLSDKRASGSTPTKKTPPPVSVRAPSTGHKSRGGTRKSAVAPTVKLNVAAPSPAATTRPAKKRASVPAPAPAPAAAPRKADPAAAIAAFEQKLRDAGVVSIAGGKDGTVQRIGQAPTNKRRKGPM